MLILFPVIFFPAVMNLSAVEKVEKKIAAVSDTICEIEKLESNRDPKCHATATRLENFMYGTKLAPETRFLKVELQKKLLLHLWKKVSDTEQTAGESAKAPVDYFRDEMGKLLKYSRQPGGSLLIYLGERHKEPITLSKRDMDHYGSIAYALRAILALQQEMLLRTDVYLIPLDQPSIAALKEFVDIFTLTVLQLADRQARLSDLYTLTPQVFREAWNNVQNSVSRQQLAYADFWKSPLQPAKQASLEPAVKFATIQKIIAQKVKSYEAYNKISMQVFLRNLQVYFARHRWPADAGEGQKFKNLFTEAMVAFAFDSLKYAGKIAAAKGRPFIREDDVEQMWQSFVPFDINEYEDVIFFPRLQRSGSLTIESYDCDAFRDSGIHWRYLQFAIQDHSAELSIEPDPFAAEFLAEGIAQFGVLVLRLAGDTAKKEGERMLKTAHLEKALQEVQRRILAHSKVKPGDKPAGSLVSSQNVTRLSGGKTYFSDVTEAAGIVFEHRSSDWLSRLLRSYLKKSATVGTLSVPPAFGGSGAAAGDVNRDGIPDLLLLSGSGNALYIGDGTGRFRDVTAEAGIVFRRPDGSFGEPRQPIIADFDNDGLQDILITYANDNHKLYKNRGKGKFVDVSAAGGLGGKGLVGGPAAVFDYDRDGLLDIYIAYFGDYLHGKLPNLSRSNLNALPNKLFRNKGNMRFEDVTGKAGVGNTGWGQALSHTDFDLDGWQDIIVGNDFGVNVYYRNRGDGTFENVAPVLGTDKPSFTMNVGITDLNRDGYPDIYISNIVTMVKDEKYVLPGANTTMKFDPAKLGRMRVIEANDLFLSKSDGGSTGAGKLPSYVLSDLVGRGFSSTGWSWDADFFDFDNDGDDDLYCVNGMNEYSVYSDTPYYTSVFKEKREIRLPVYEKESNVFFVNQGGKLLNFSKESGVDFLGNSRSTVYLDFDNDGDLDIVLNNYHGPARVYRNNSQRLQNHWIKIELTGDPAGKSNRDAIGAKIIAFKDGKQLAWREIRGGHGYLSMDPKTQHMGLGKAEAVDIRVTWPNGETSTYKNVRADRTYHIEQGSPAPRPRGTGSL